MIKAGRRSLISFFFFCNDRKLNIFQNKIILYLNHTEMSQSKKLKKTRATKRGTFLGRLVTDLGWFLVATFGKLVGGVH